MSLDRMSWGETDKAGKQLLILPVVCSSGVALSLCPRWWKHPGMFCSHGSALAVSCLFCHYSMLQISIQHMKIKNCRNRFGTLMGLIKENPLSSPPAFTHFLFTAVKLCQTASILTGRKVRVSIKKISSSFLTVQGSLTFLPWQTFTGS